MSPSDDAVWTSLPVPALVLDARDRIVRINPSAEGFLNSSAKALIGAPIWDTLMVDAPLEEAFARARDLGTPLFVNDVDVGEVITEYCVRRIRPGFGLDAKYYEAVIGSKCLKAAKKGDRVTFEHVTVDVN